MTIAMKKTPIGYKQTELGVIPEDWELKECGKLGSFHKGKGISSKDLVSDGVPCIMYGDIYVKFDIKFSKPDYRITKETASKSSLAKKGDLFFTGSGETAEEIGKCVVYQGNDDIYFGGDIIVLTSNLDNDCLFLAYMQNSKMLLTQKANLGQGYTVVHIYTGHIKSLKMPIPPTKAEQTAIATVLSDTDALIEHLEKLIAKKKAIKQGTMQQLLTGKKRLPGFSGKWEVKKLGDLVQYKNGKSFENVIVEDGEFFLITLNSIDITGKFKTEHLRVRVFDNSLEKGDLVMVLSDVAHGNFLGLTDVIPENNKYVLNQRMGALKKLDGVLPKFLSIYINYYQPYFKMSGKGSSQQNLGKDDILKFEISLPSPVEQTVIATILSDMDVEIQSLEQKRDKYTMLKQGMMQQLLTGRIRIYANT